MPIQPFAIQSILPFKNNPPQPNDVGRQTVHDETARGNSFAGDSFKRPFDASDNQKSLVPISPVSAKVLDANASILTPEPEDNVEDDFCSPVSSLGSKKIMGLFAAGVAAAVLGRSVFQLFKKAPEAAKSLAKTAEKSSKQQPEKLRGAFASDENLELYPTHQQKGFASIFMAMIYNPDNRGAFFGYLASAALGYIGASLAQGIQESWVRRQETLIRANLINRMQQAFRKSIHVKQVLDTSLMDDAARQIEKLLLRAGITNAKGLVAPNLISASALLEPKRTQQEYFYQPTHRAVRVVTQPAFAQFGAGLFEAGGNYPGNTSSNFNPLKQKFSDNLSMQRGILESVIFGAGVTVGSVIQGFIRLLKMHLTLQQTPKNIKEQVYLTFDTVESWWLTRHQSQRSLMVLGGFLALSAAAKLGKLFIDGIREVEVTRRNAQTEYLYQKHNWLTQDPSFHRIAEEEALRHELDILWTQLPALRNDPVRLQERIQTILTNIGRNSAPKYFPMTPAVNLVDARS